MAGKIRGGSGAVGRSAGCRLQVESCRLKVESCKLTAAPGATCNFQPATFISHRPRPFVTEALCSKVSAQLHGVRFVRCFLESSNRRLANNALSGTKYES